MLDVDSEQRKAEHAKRLETAYKLIAYLQERENVGRLLHAEGDKFIASGNFEQAVKCCQTSALLALGAGDMYAHGASQFHLGLYYFICYEGDWDRAANFFKDAALIFHTSDPQRAEGVAYYAAARIQQEACEQGQNRWEGTLDNALRALTLLQNVGDLGHITTDFFYRFNKRYAEHLASTVAPSASYTPPPAPTPGAEERTGAYEPAPAKEYANTAGASAPPRPREPVTPTPATNGHAAPEETRNENSYHPGHVFHTPMPKQQSVWSLYMSAVFALIGIILMGGTGFGALYLVQYLPEYGFGLALGLGGVTMATVAPFMVLEFMGQLRFTGKSGVAAVILDSATNQILPYLDTQTHWLRPFREMLVAWLPMDVRETHYLASVPLGDAFGGKAAHLIIKFSVEEPALVWDHIAKSCTPIKRFGIPFPLRVPDTEGQLKDYAGMMAAQEYGCLAPSLQSMSDAARSKRLCASMRETGVAHRHLVSRDSCA